MNRQEKKLSLCVILLLSTIFTSVSSFGAHKASEKQHSMEKLVLGTVALPNVKGGSYQLLQDAYERGFTRFDLARSYGGGKSEKLFGEWLRKSGVDRSELCLVTKGGMGSDKYGDPNRPLCTMQTLRSEITASLEALQTNYADIYMLHRDDPRIPASDFCDWMNELKRDGLIHRWGVSNWGLHRIHEAHEHAKQTGQEPPTATSPQLSLAVPSSEVWPTTYSLSCPSKASEINWYKENGIEIMGWESMAKGFMAVPTLWREHEVDISNFHGPNAELGTDTWRLQRIQRAYCTPGNYARRRIATQLAKESGLSLAQITLLYCLAKGDHVSALVGADQRKHLDEMAEIQNFFLDEEAVDCLTAASTNPSIVARVASEVRRARVETEEDVAVMVEKEDMPVEEEEAIFIRSVSEELFVPASQTNQTLAMAL